MATYRVTGEISISCFTIVEAESVAEAIEIAKERGGAGAGEVAYSDELWCCEGELDGTPMRLRAEPWKEPR